MSEKTVKKIGLIGMSALIVGSVIGGGIFNLMKDMAKESSVGPIIIALVISGIGMGIFVFSMQNLNEKLPHLDAGIYSYAEEGFGRFAGFMSAFGYWISLLFGNVALGTLSMSALSFFVPAFGNGSNKLSVIVASLLLWAMHIAMLKGSDVASKINSLITGAKLIPLAIFVLVVIFAFDWNTFTTGFWGDGVASFSWREVAPQLRSALIISVWVFIGVEGAVVYSGRAKNKRVISQANILSFALVTLIYLLATVGVFGIASRAEIAGLEKPAMAPIMGAVVGDWGTWLINLGVFISCVGCWFACTMLSGEILYQGAKDGIFPHIFARQNKDEAPTQALFISNAFVQVFLLSLLINKSAYNFMAVLASSTMLVPYFFVSLSQMKLSYGWAGKKIDKNVMIGALSSIYMAYCMYASGFDYILLTALIFAPSILLYMYSRKEEHQKAFNRYEKISVAVVVACSILAMVLLYTGTIDITTM